jgi:hypothetical protein
MQPARLLSGASGRGRACTAGRTAVGRTAVSAVSAHAMRQPTEAPSRITCHASRRASARPSIAAAVFSPSVAATSPASVETAASASGRSDARKVPIARASIVCVATATDSHSWLSTCPPDIASGAHVRNGPPARTHAAPKRAEGDLHSAAAACSLARSQARHRNCAPAARRARHGSCTPTRGHSHAPRRG